MYVSRARAKSEGQHWALKQLDDRIEVYDPPLQTQEEKKQAVRAEWVEFQREDRREWVCEIRSGEVGKERLVVRVQMFVVEGGQG